MAKAKKIFVLDTSVILYSFNAINTFEDNDVAIPITVLEELDNFKKEMIPIIFKLENLLESWIDYQKQEHFKNGRN